MSDHARASSQRCTRCCLQIWMEEFASLWYVHVSEVFSGGEHGVRGLVLPWFKLIEKIALLH